MYEGGGGSKHNFFFENMKKNKSQSDICSTLGRWTGNDSLFEDGLKEGRTHTQITLYLDRCPHASETLIRSSQDQTFKTLRLSVDGLITNSLHRALQQYPRFKVAFCISQSFIQSRNGLLLSFHLLTL